VHSYLTIFDKINSLSVGCTSGKKRKDNKQRSLYGHDACVLRVKILMLPEAETRR